tara:strand:- start:202 stop:447 length:246 start_codon:yes stop_codon:yes gene_type:complete
MKDISKFLKERISSFINIYINEIDSNTSISKTPEWDSLAHMQILSILSDKFQFELNPEVIINLSSYELLLNYLNYLKNDKQ